jgi:hypothetical protein
MAIEVFISYSHKDRALREELEIHLSKSQEERARTILAQRSS